MRGSHREQRGRVGCTQRHLIVRTGQRRVQTRPEASGPLDGILIRAYGRKHILFENKVTSPVDSQGQPTTPEAAVAACGGTAPALRDAIEDKYVHARRKGHIVVPLLHEVFGGIAPETIKFVAEAAARTRGRKLADHDDPSAPWSAPTLSPYLFQSISVALQTAVANQILDRVAEEDGLAALGSA